MWAGILSNLKSAASSFMKAYNDWVTGKKKEKMLQMSSAIIFMSFSVSLLGYFKNAVVNILVHTKSFTGSISECDVIYGYIT